MKDWGGRHNEIIECHRLSAVSLSTDMSAITCSISTVTNITISDWKTKETESRDVA